LGLMLRGRLRKRLLPTPDREGEGVLRVDENANRDLGQRQLARALLRERVPASLRLARNGLLSRLSLLFVHAGVGVMLHFELIAR
ncbi:CidA/LrgA family protein, partial [Pseudoalteromonas sp. SIMBA_148]